MLRDKQIDLTRAAADCDSASGQVKCGPVAGAGGAAPEAAHSNLQPEDGARVASMTLD